MASNLLSGRLRLSNAHFKYMHHWCKILVVGGGTGGCTMAAKLAKKFHDPPNQVTIIEPSDTHYYQPLFTLIGGGISQFSSSKRAMKDVLPGNAKWVKDSVASFEPEKRKVITKNGDVIKYDIMIVAMGLQLHWEKIPGLKEAVEDTKSQVCSIYGHDTVKQVFEKISKTKDGTAIFTFPNSPVKCPGAPQKIAYLAEDYFRKNNKRNNIDVVYNTALPVIFGVKKYANSLWDVCKSRNITVNLQTNLIEIHPEKNEAVFQKLDTEKTIVQKYSLLHVCPPMGPPKVLKQCSALTNEQGFLTVDSKTLQHTKYPNIYGIGDCTNTPNSKTMAAIAAQAKVLYRNIMNNLEGKEMSMSYDGYASCPLVTGKGKCILAEFDYNLQPLETFPVNQGKEYYFTYLLKKEFFPFIYWNLMLKGRWNGPEFFRNCTKMLKRG